MKNELENTGECTFKLIMPNGSNHYVLAVTAIDALRKHGMALAAVWGNEKDGFLRLDRSQVNL